MQLLHTHTHTQKRERGKCYSLNSTKYVQDWYEENYKTDENTFKDLNRETYCIYGLKMIQHIKGDNYHPTDLQA